MKIKDAILATLLLVSAPILIILTLFIAIIALPFFALADTWRSLYFWIKERNEN